MYLLLLVATPPVAALPAGWPIVFTIFGVLMVGLAVVIHRGQRRDR